MRARFSLPFLELLVVVLVTAASASVAAAGAGTTFVVPIVLSAGGAHGSFYTSELTLTNRGDASATVEMRYTAAIGSGDGTCQETVPAGEQKVIPDVIAYLCERGLPLPASGDRGGTLQLTFIGGAPSDAAVTVRTTTATQAPQPAGSAGLAYPGVLPESGITTAATLYGLRSTAADRSNVAVYNPTADTVTVKVTAHAGDGSGVSAVKAEALEVPGLGWTQLGNVLDGTGITSGWVTIEKTAGSGAFGAYGVINCNGTSDGSFVTPVRGGASGSRITVPVLVETTSGFVSELVLSNRSATEATLTLSYVESLAPSLGAGGSVGLTLRPREQLILPDALDTLRGKGLGIGAKGAASYAGTLRIGVAGAALADVFAGARTASLCPSGGQFGLFTPGVYEGGEATNEAYLYGLRADETNRTNVAVAHTGASDSGAVTLELQAYDGEAGGVRGGDAERVTLEPGGWYQASGFLGGRGVRNGWVRVARVSGSAPWIAYGVVNDGGSPGARTGDGAYIPMVVGEPVCSAPWEIVTLPAAFRLYPKSLLYDPAGNPSIAYDVGGQKEVGLARWNATTSTWSFETVHTFVGAEYAAKAPAHAYDPKDGNPSIVYGFDTITFAHWDGSTWKTEIVESGVPYNDSPKLVYDPDGNPSISYWSPRTNPGLRFARRSGSRWTLQTAAPDLPQSVTSLAFDPLGRPAIAYGARVGITTDTLKLARWTGSKWETEVVESGVKGYGVAASLAFDAAGRPAVTHGIGNDPSGIRLVRWDGESWGTEIVSRSGGHASLAFDPSGANLAAYMDYGEPSRRSVKLARREPTGEWRVEVVEEVLDSSSSLVVLRLDSSGLPSLAYVHKVGGVDRAVFARRTCR